MTGLDNREALTMLKRDDVNGHCFNGVGEAMSEQFILERL
jgi:hypothetical protein